MKRIYWKPNKITRRMVFFLGLAAVAAMASVELFQREVPQPFHAEKVAAAQLAERAMAELKQERIRRGHPVEPQYDPAETGLIGTLLTPVTSVSGHLESKQTSVNPNFAALLVDLLTRAGVRPGDRVAVGYSGSFPAVNLCLCAALETLKVRPVVVASASASQFGANLPDFMWVDMERHLYDKGLISFHSVAASRGGYEDRGVGMTDEARRLVGEAIDRNGLQLLELDSFEESVDARMQLYGRQAGGEPYKAYVNVGGGTVSVGRSLGKKMYRPGLNLEPPLGATAIDSVMTRFMKQDTPVVHMVQIAQLAEEYGMPIAPQTTPAVGQSTVYIERRYNRPLAVVTFVLLAALLVAAAQKDAVARVLGRGATAKGQESRAAEMEKLQAEPALFTTQTSVTKDPGGY